MSTQSELISASQELVRLHGGTITVTSTPTSSATLGKDHGSTFTVIVPLGINHLVASQVEPTHADMNTKNSYGRAVVEEASRWRGTSLSGNDTPSDLIDSSPFASASDTSRSSTVDSLGLFFQKSDVVLLGQYLNFILPFICPYMASSSVDDNSDMRHVCFSVKFTRRLQRQHLISATNSTLGLCKCVSTRRPCECAYRL